MLRLKILSMLSILVVSIATLFSAALPVLAAAPVKVAASPTCKISLLAPWKAGNQIRARATITCSAPYANLKVTVWVAKKPSIYGNPKTVTCHNTKSCQATASEVCTTGYWASADDGQVWNPPQQFWNPYSPYTYIKC